MTSLASLARDLRDTTAEIARIERAISSHPAEKGLLVNLAALQKRMRVLELQFAEFSKNDFLDICDYRLIPHSPGNYPISAVGSVLVTFQHMVTVFLDAIKSGPKLRARISPDVASSSSMNFGYSFSGSLGFTMTVPNDRLLAVDSDLDMAIERAFQVVNARETSDIAVLAKEIGVASVRSAYTWAKHHAKYQLSAAIDWKRGQQVRNHTFLEAEQLARVAALIEQTSETTEERLTLPGILEGVNTTRRTFQFGPVEGDEIQGRISENLSFERPFEVPSAVVIDVIKRTKVHYSIDKEEINWELIDWKSSDEAN
jgi:hypothetical protein